jgi:FMN phosphatase YigB (HAD superfamily)
MPFRQFKALTFDVVGTLIDFERGIINHVRAVAGDAAQHLSDDVILEATVIRGPTSRLACTRMTWFASTRTSKRSFSCRMSPAQPKV